MKNNTEEKSLVVTGNKNIITKMIDFIRNIFKKDKKIVKNTEESIKKDDIQTVQKHSFMVMDEIEIKYQKFRNREIKEEDLTEEEKQQLIKMFQERIKIKQERIKYLKKNILDARAKYLRMTQQEK